MKGVWNWINEQYGAGYEWGTLLVSRYVVFISCKCLSVKAIQIIMWKAMKHQLPWSVNPKYLVTAGTLVMDYLASIHTVRNQAAGPTAAKAKDKGGEMRQIGRSALDCCHYERFAIRTHHCCRLGPKTHLFHWKFRKKTNKKPNRLG